MKKLCVAVMTLCCLLLPAFGAGTVLAAETATAAVAAPVNLNQADAAGLQNLPGIGPALAERIVAHRDAHGPFQSIDQLTDVSGIGAKKLAKMRDHLTLE